MIVCSGYQLPVRILLAPMEGLLDHLLRDTLTQPANGTTEGSGIDACVTEFIRITSTLLPADRFHRVVPELRNRGCTPSGVPVRVQLLGSDPVCMAENAAHAAFIGPIDGKYERVPRRELPERLLLHLEHLKRGQTP